MDIPLVSPRKLDQYVARYPGVWIVDVRSGEEYRRSHIRYAVNIPYEPGKEWNLPGEKEIVVTVGSETAYVDGAEVELDAPALEMDGRTMVPLRFLGESFGIKVQWDDEAKTAVLSSQG